MQYNAMPGSVILRTTEKTAVTKNVSGILVVEAPEKRRVEIAEIISVGDERDDLSVGMQVVFPTDTGLRLDKNLYYLKYEDICAVLS